MHLFQRALPPTSSLSLLFLLIHEFALYNHTTTASTTLTHDLRWKVDIRGEAPPLLGTFSSLIPQSLTHLQGSCWEAAVSVGAAQVARQGPGSLHRWSPRQNLSDWRPLARLQLEWMAVGVHVSSVGVYKTTRRHHVGVPVGHGFDRPIGAIEVHGDVHVAHTGRDKICRVGLALSWVECQGRGGRGEGRVVHRDVERLILAPQAQASLGGGRRGLETDRPTR